MPQEHTVHLRRHRLLPSAGGGTVFCTMTFSGDGPALAFLDPGQFPEFEGEEAWFRVLWHSKRKRDFIRQIDPPAGRR